MAWLETACCIAGGGPAGMMLGYLLARAGVDVVVLEKHADFLRDFRGDTIHPSTLRVMDELGLLDEFLKLPHQEIRHLSAKIGASSYRIADFSHLPGRCRFLAFMPQWDFLDFVAREAGTLPHFTLRMNSAATGLIEENGRVVGLRGAGPDGAFEVRAALVVGADGRRSTIRAAAGLRVEPIGAPMDVLWFSLPRHPDDRAEAFGRLDGGRMLILIDRGTHWQAGYVIAKGADAALRAKGLAAFRAELAALEPFLADRMDAIGSWDDVKLLTVGVDRLRTWWKPGLLCIGDAAHTMSPVGGVGVNLAIQDAVACANRLAPALRERRVADTDLAWVQRRREWPTRVTQRIQVAIQNRVIGRVLGGDGPLAVPPAVPLSAPWALRAAGRMAWLQQIPARLIGLGVRPEHVRHRGAPIPLVRG